jgi:uncharacterized protein YlxP (DUF503 family)
LKEKRHSLRSIMDRMRAACRASVAECGFQDTWQRASLLVTFASSDHAGMNKRANLLRRIVEDHDEAEILSWADEVCEP